MSDIPNHLLGANKRNILDEVRRATVEKPKCKTIFSESVDMYKSNRNGPRHDTRKGSTFGARLTICNNKTNGQAYKRRSTTKPMDGGDGSSNSVVNHVTKRKDDILRDLSSDSDCSSSTLSDGDVSSIDAAGGLSTSSILELYDTTIKSDNAKLKRLQAEIKRSYTSCFLKHELVVVATLCSSQAKHLLKPCPKFFMVNNEPCYEELKNVLRTIKSLRNILAPKNSALLENRILLDVLHWTFFESKLPTFIEIKFSQTQHELHKIDILRLTLKPSLIVKVKYGQYSNQEVNYRYYLKYLRQNRENFDIKLGYVAVHLQFLYQVLADGIDVLIHDRRGMAIYSNFIASVESVRDNVYYIMNSNYNNGSNLMFEYFAVLVTEVLIQKDSDISRKSKNSFSTNRKTANGNDFVFFVKNVKRIKTKFIFFFRIGSNKMFKKLISIDKKMHAQFMLDAHAGCSLERGSFQIEEDQTDHLTAMVALYVVGILLSVVCFIWYMKIWRYF